MSNVVPFPMPTRIEEKPRIVASADLVEGLQAEDPTAVRQLLASYSSHVERIMRRILGSDADHEDAVQETFIRVLDKIDRLEEPNALPGFVTSIAVNVAREQLRKQKRSRWLRFFSPDELPESIDATHNDEAKDALASFYRIVRTMDEIHQVIFTLRVLERLELAEIAKSTDRSVSTIKRKLESATQQFNALAKSDPSLAPWMKGDSDPSGNVEEVAWIE